MGKHLPALWALKGLELSEKVVPFLVSQLVLVVGTPLPDHVGDLPRFQVHRQTSVPVKW